MKEERVKEYRVCQVSCEWTDGRCTNRAYESIRVWPDGGAGPYCYRHMRMYVESLERDGYRQKKD